MSDIMWEDPPEHGNTKGPPYGRHAGIAAELKAHPGEWAKVLVDTSLGAAHQIKKGTYRAYQPAGAFEAVTRNSRNVDGRTRCDIYARYVGDEVTK